MLKLYNVPCCEIKTVIIIWSYLTISIVSFFIIMSELCSIIIDEL